MEADRHDALLREIVAILREVTGEDEQWSSRVTETSRLEDDLRLESIEFAALGRRLRDRYGDGVDLCGFVAQLDLDGIIALRVWDLMTLVQHR